MECGICYEIVTKDNLEILECAHSLCQLCLGKLRQHVCPFCRNPIGGSTVSPLHDETQTQTQTQTPRGRNVRLGETPQSRRRSRRRRSRRMASSVTQVNAPQQISSNEINDMINDIAESSNMENEDGNDVSISDNRRQHRRNIRNRWKEQNAHNYTRIHVR